jgi:hypothetical protein
MKKQTLLVFLFSSLFALGLLGILARPVSAKYSAPKSPPPPHPTFIVLNDPGAHQLGQSYPISGKLTSSGNPVPDASIILTLDGKFLGQTRTDKKGDFLLKVTEDLSGGSYELGATFKGTRLLALSRTSVPLIIEPALVRIQTVPPIAGVPFTMDGRQFFSREDGIAEISIPTPGQYRLTVQADQYSNPTQRIEFARWLDESFQAFRDLKVPVKDEETIVVGLNVYYRVNQTFIDLDGKPVDPKRITGITIKSAQGDIFNYKEGQTMWVPASRVARRASGLQQTKLLYSVMGVTVDGSNVVIAAQQRFYTGSNETWRIALTLYSVQINTRDILLGSPVGNAVLLKYPNGRVESYPLNAAGSVSIPSLARGIYQIQLTGINGLDTTTPVALSRDQVVTQNVVTYLDLAIVGAFGLFIALGLLLFGRPWLLVSRKHRLKFKSYAVREANQVSIHDN